jgi:acyl-CoA thioesterase I
MRNTGGSTGIVQRGIAAALCIAALLFCSTLHAQPDKDPRPVILAIGESTTAGFGVPADRSYPAQLQHLLDAQGYDYRVVNHGRSGSTTAMALSGLDRGMALFPRIVLIALGGNDQGNRALRTEENLRKIVSMFVRTDARVYVAERTPDDRASPDASAMVARIAAEEGAMLMPSLRQDIAGHSELLLSDGSHPNAEGYSIVAQHIFDMLEPVLRKPEP